MRRIDISLPLRPGMPAFPGDPAFRTERVHSLERGGPYNLSSISLGTHAGTHVDPPLHFLPDGVPADGLDLGVLNGPCEVLSVPPDRREVGPAELAALPRGTERVLLATANSPRWSRALEFFRDYVALTAGGAKSLVSRGVRLVGIDSLSIESDPSGQFPVHHTLLSHGTLILEGLLLDGVPAGPYELECLPLRLAGGDGGPARAVLRAP